MSSTKSLPEPMLSYCQFGMCELKFQWELNKDKQIQENTFQNTIGEIRVFFFFKPENWLSNMPSDAMAPCVARAFPVMIMYDKQVLVIHEEGLQLPVASQSRKYKCTNILMFP